MEYDFNNNLQESSASGGATWYGAVMPKRNIVLKGSLISKNYADYAGMREKLRQIFGLNQKITLTADDGMSRRAIESYVESVEFSDGKVSKLKNIMVSLLCPEPFFFDKSDSEAVFCGAFDTFTFPFEPKANDTELGKLNRKQIYILNNLSESDSTGITVVFAARGTVVNPQLLHIKKNELIKINYTMLYGDVIRVTTDKGNKNVWLDSGGETIKINYAFDDESGNNGFIMLARGENPMRVDADSGLSDLDIKVLYRSRYLGA
jgi:hypothetical protein